MGLNNRRLRKNKESQYTQLELLSFFLLRALTELPLTVDLFLRWLSSPNPINLLHFTHTLMFTPPPFMIFP